MENTKIVKHIILWQLHENLTNAEKEKIKSDIKQGLENLKGEIPEILDIKVHTNGLPTSNADIMLESSFKDTDALKTYAEHPKHVAVADNLIRPYAKTRVCLDFEE